ncbi:MAG: zf-HC2 domain-containing protein [Candidatus Tenebribacter burtonii]|jgi:anti-sigma factor RsiW|nr:zf-HC2 domain-containing protein [Candidatus Tenebribacter burtonii]
MKQDNECSFSKKLNAYIAGELSEMEHEEVRAHISSCHLCQKKIRELNQVENFLMQYTDEEVPTGLNEKILNSVSRSYVNPFKRKVVSFSIAASIIVSFVTGIFLSDITFTQETESDFDFGQNTLYSYFEGE